MGNEPLLTCPALGTARNARGINTDMCSLYIIEFENQVSEEYYNSFDRRTKGTGGSVIRDHPIYRLVFKRCLKASIMQALEDKRNVRSTHLIE